MSKRGLVQVEDGEYRRGVGVLVADLQPGGDDCFELGGGFRGPLGFGLRPAACVRVGLGTAAPERGAGAQGRAAGACPCPGEQRVHGHKQVERIDAVDHDATSASCSASSMPCPLASA